MAAYRQVTARLSDDFKAREVARLVYFHCDHFEPWLPFGGRDTYDERNAEHLRFFAEDLRQIDYARKLEAAGNAMLQRLSRDRITRLAADIRAHHLRPHPDGRGDPAPNSTASTEWLREMV
jgi:hypothetical protein